ncbi:MAG: gamma-glutamyltransferase [Gemmatimonadota bacterium]
MNPFRHLISDESMNYLDLCHLLRNRLRGGMILAAILVAGAWPASLDARQAAAGTSETAAQGQLFPPGWGQLDRTPLATGRNGAVATTDTLATQVGLEILQAGGTAMDAAIAVSFALAVVNPAAGNIGGGGFMVTRESDGTVSALDYRETAPAAATRDMYLDAQGELSDRSVLGHLAAGVPGTVMGMWTAHLRWGTLPWEALVRPAIQLAHGFQVHERFARSVAGSAGQLRRFPESARVFLPGGAPPAVGDTFHQPDLARTLERIRDLGPDGFYRGETADLLVAEMERGGGIITHEDLADYQARWREPVAFTYRGHRVYSMPPSSSGGMTLAMMAGMLEPWDLGSLPWGGPRRVHLLSEVWKRAYADRNEYMADSDFVAVPRQELLDPSYLTARSSTITLDAATPSREVSPGLAAPWESEETTHFSVVDRHGNAVAVTTTINSGYGNKVTVTGAGFLLNNEMDDFSARPGFPNQFGLVQGEANAIEPGKRMLSAMSPSIVLDPQGRLRLITGTPGGSTIITTVFQTISNVVDYNMSATDAVRAPRVHHQHLPDAIQFERGGLRPETVAALKRLGHVVRERGGYSGDVQLILVDGDGLIHAVADPRVGGVALAY